MSGHADTIRRALNVECECEQCKPARAALDALLDENRRLRASLRWLRSVHAQDTNRWVIEEIEKALAGNTE